MLIAMLAAAAVAAGADAPQAPATEVAPATAVAPARPETPKKDDRMVCVSEKMTGSNRKTKVCYNPRQRREETRDALANQHVRDAATPGIGSSR